MEEEGTNLKTCICFVPLGVAAELPIIYDVDDNEALLDKSGVSVDQNSSMRCPASAETKLPDELCMDDYDDDDADLRTGAQLSVLTEADINLIAHGDPLIDKSELEKVEDDLQDLKINPSLDYPIVLGAIEGAEEATVETVIYSKDESLNFAHHSIVTEAFPLALAWLPIYKTHRKKHIIAVASFLPVIEIYNNDIIDQIEPDGRLDSQEIHHSAAVSSLSVNPMEPHLLLSASHDQTAIVWDTKTLRPVKHFVGLANGKINAAEWCPDGRRFVVGGESQELVLINAKSGDKSIMKIDEVVEDIVWINERVVVAVTQNGSLMCYRVNSHFQLQLLAETTVCDGPALTVCKTMESDLIVIGCENGCAHVYDLSESGVLSKICEKNMQQGPLYDVKSSPDLPHLVAFAANDVVVWDLAYEEAVRKCKGLPVPA